MVGLSGRTQLAGWFRFCCVPVRSGASACRRWPCLGALRSWLQGGRGLWPVCCLFVGLLSSAAVFCWPLGLVPCCSCVCVWLLLFLAAGCCCCFSLMPLWYTHTHTQTHITNQRRPTTAQGPQHREQQGEAPEQRGGHRTPGKQEYKTLAQHHSEQAAHYQPNSADGTASPATNCRPAIFAQLNAYMRKIS